MNTATKADVTARPYTDPDEPGEPGLRLSGAADDLLALLEELPTAGALGLDHDGVVAGEVHVWRARVGATAEEVEAGVRKAAAAAGGSLEVVS